MIAIIKTKGYISPRNFGPIFLFFRARRIQVPKNYKFSIILLLRLTHTNFNLQISISKLRYSLLRAEKLIRNLVSTLQKMEDLPSFRIITGARFSIAESGRISYGALLHHHHVPFKRESARKSSSTTLTSLYRPYTGPVVYRLCMHGANLVPFGRAHSLQTEVPTLWSVVTQA